MKVTPESFKRYSAASKARWAKRDPEERSEWMRRIAIAKQMQMTPEEKSAHGKMMIQAKLDKRKK